MSDKHVVVTGGAGFIGSNIVDAYIDRGWSVTVIDNLSSGSKKNLNRAAEFIEGDVTSVDDLSRAIREGVTHVNHHAAQIDVRKSVADPAWDAEQNVVASIRLCERAREVGVKKVIFASSGGAGYGEPQFAPQTEDHPYAPMSPYGCAKVSVELYLGFYRLVYGIDTVALRYGNVYGPRQSKHGEAGVVAIFGGKILAGEEITINGDGKQTRDYVFVGDVVNANMAASERSDIVGSYNVGTGIETDVNVLAKKIAVALALPLSAKHGPAKAGEQMRSVLDASKLWNAAGLPAPKSVDDGLKITMDWLRSVS
jgi:UDP-glucose 4-epimerase